MWPPPNIQAFPSKEEIRQTKEEISSIELQLIDVQLKMEALQKSIAERKAWIAPIRKLPHDVLSQIFIEVSMDNWKAPLTLQSVSRWWHDVVVGTPRAWTFIPLFECDKEGHSDFVSLFIERSRNVALHLFVGDRHSFPQMKMLASRIECINLEITLESIKYFVPSEYNFTRLERLQLTSVDWDLSPDQVFKISGWDMMQFPNLKSLELAVWHPLLLAIATSPRFPLIRRLKVDCSDPSPLTDILVKCAKSLESIDLNYGALPSRSPDITPMIHLPFPRYMRLRDDTSGRGDHWCINGPTPSLEAYCDVGFWPTIKRFKLDVRNVTFLRVVTAPDLSRYPQLITLCFEGNNEDLMEVINSLRERPESSPDLAVIEYDKYLPSEGVEEANTALLALMKETGRRVRLERIDWRMLEEIEIHRRWVPQPCSEHMPCQFLAS